jgi:hypothetical protein
MSATISTNLPSVDDWMTMRARLIDVMGDPSATTLLSVFPQPAEGGFASNGRLDLMETRLRAEIRTSASDLRAEFRSEFVSVRTEVAESASSLRAEIAESASDIRTEMRSEFVSVRAETASLRDEMRAEFVSVRAETALLRSDMRAEFAAARGETKAGFAEVRAEFADVRTEIAKSASETLKSMRAMFLQQLGLLCSMAALVVAGVKLL